MAMMKSLIFVNSHPIQYFAPMYKYMNEEGLETKAWYCSDEFIKGGTDIEFGVDVKWDIPLLDGYKYTLFRNYSWNPSVSSGFFGLINLGMIWQLFKEPRSVIVVHGWHYFTHFMILMLGTLAGHKVCVRNDMPQSHELFKKGWKQVVKKFGLKYILFPRINNFMYIGSQNRLLYKSYGLADDRLVLCPYCVDNERFRGEFAKIKPLIPSLKSKFGIPSGDKIIIFSAKYIHKKRPLDLLRAFIKMDNKKCWLIMVGEGELRAEMEALIKKSNAKRIILTGFVNQSQISNFYAMGDLFVMCSSVGENWGLSVNEAMNFNLPLVLSDLTGCSADLVEEGVNGYIYRTGDIDELTKRLVDIISETKLTWKTSSEDIVNKFSFSVVLRNINGIL